MSDPVSAALGAVFKGPDAAIEELGAVGMVTIRGDFRSKTFAAAVAAETGCALPDQRRFVSGEAGGLAWMSPDELLFTTAYAAAPGVAARLTEALAGEHHMALNVSDARAAFRISGPGARELIAKGAPVDMSPEGFGAGEIRRTRLSQVAVAFWISGGDAITLVCFRSVGAYVFDWLKASAADGARPGLF